MITDEQEELVALYAFDLLEEPELGKFTAAMERDPALRALVNTLRETAASLALTAEQIAPPAELRAQVLAATPTTRQSPTPTNVNTTAPSIKVVPFPLLRFLPWATAAAFAVATLWLASQNFLLRSQNTDLQTAQRLAEVAYQMAQNQLSERSLLAEGMIADLGKKLQRTEDLARLKVTALASLAGNTPEAKVIAVWDPEQQTGLLTLEKLPPTNENQDYQIWIVDPAYKNPVNGGVFHVSADGTIPPLTFKPDQPVAQAAAFAISVEKKGGVPKAEGPIVLLGK